MATLGDILGATLSSDCCEWSRGAPRRAADIFIPESSGIAATDRLKCCEMLPKDTSTCCDSNYKPDYGGGAVEGIDDTDAFPRRLPVPVPVPSVSASSDDSGVNVPIFPSDDPQRPMKDKATQSAPTPHQTDTPAYVQMTNQARGSFRALSWSKTQELLAKSKVNDIFHNGCVVPTAENPGVNTFALKNCSQTCTWPDIINSWSAEQGHAACQVAHRVTLLNPQAGEVGCALQTKGNCLAAVCIYDKGAAENTALSVAASQARPQCDHAACCGALPCANTLC
uniref:SCP domain-containing protein n=1 Tax=viral metagenome TaxID=1070528 RepID=A0A6C0BZ79_9ZZZZ